MPNPRTHSGKQDSLTNWQWPVASRDMLKDFQRLADTHSEEQINKPLFFLIAARKSLGDTKIAIGAAKRLQSDKATADRLESILSAIDQELQRFPLTVIN